MATLIGYIAQDREELSPRLQAVAETLRATHAATAWGVGFYQGGEVLHKKKPLTSPTDDPTTQDPSSTPGAIPPPWHELVEGVRTPCALFHARLRTVGDFRAENTQPFRFGSWNFAHHGTLHGFEQLREPMLAHCPDFIARNVRGNSDSELLFHWLLSFIREHTPLDRLDPEARALTQGVQEGIAQLQQLCRSKDLPRAGVTSILTNGRALYTLSDERSFQLLADKKDPFTIVADVKPNGAPLRQLQKITATEPPEILSTLE